MVTTTIIAWSASTQNYAAARRLLAISRSWILYSLVVSVILYAYTDVVASLPPPGFPFVPS